MTRDATATSRTRKSETFVPWLKKAPRLRQINLSALTTRGKKNYITREDKRGALKS